MLVCVKNRMCPFRLPQLQAALLWLLLSLLLAGCATPPHRARQYAAEFARFEEAEQGRLLRGHFSIGDTREMVYVALGPPARQTVAVDRAIPGPWLRDFEPGGYFPTGVPMLERWHYRGRPVAHVWILRHGVWAFQTPNDAFYFEAPWRQRARNGLIEVDFFNDRVDHARWLPGLPAPAMQSAPVIRLPRSPLSPFATPRSRSGSPIQPGPIHPAVSLPGYNFQ